jgi:response regulator RpfG family c-di-GMP phosphodiesterase
MEAVAEILDFINSENGHNTTYFILLDHIATHLNIDAVALILRTKYGFLEYTAGLGFHTNNIIKALVENGETLAKEVLETKKIFRYNNLSLDHLSKDLSAFMDKEKFTDYLGIPLLVQNNVQGVIELFNRTMFETTRDWQIHLRIIAALTANIIAKKDLLEKREMSRIELEIAYSETLLAWVRALEIRDEYTAGHTQRALELTLRLATRLGVPDDMLVHITRGVLLHDIGKIGVSDTVLKKTGPLTEDEWDIMREHPIYAYKLLKPIQYLKQALDIPYYHHERWNGSGYPQGLKGDEIPFAARIFSVVDVWDALITNRPYREAWKKSEALEYIKSKSGIEFDPRVTAEFIDMIVSDGVLTVPLTREI